LSPYFSYQTTPANVRWKKHLKYCISQCQILSVDGSYENLLTFLQVNSKLSILNNLLSIFKEFHSCKYLLSILPKRTYIHEIFDTLVNERGKLKYDIYSVTTKIYEIVFEMINVLKVLMNSTFYNMTSNQCSHSIWFFELSS